MNSYIEPNKTIKNRVDMPKPYYIDEQCDTAREFIDFLIHGRHFSTGTIWDAVTVGINNFIFRGQANQDWPLLPNAFRKGNPLLEFSPYTTGGPIKDDQNEVQYLGAHLQSELRAVFLFLENADKVGIPTPIDFTNLLEHKALILSALNKDPDMDYTKTYPDPSSLDGIALAQHHGVPTRLLDWTESPLVAAFFASINAINEVSETKIQSDRISVIFFRMDNQIHEDINLAIVNTPRHGNTFLRSQRGLFTYSPTANDYFIHFREWPSLERLVLNDMRLHKRLGRVTLPSDQATEVLKLLYDFGITRLSMMPSLGNAAFEFKYVRKLFPS